jgi:hypothetical protein
MKVFRTTPVILSLFLAAPVHAVEIPNPSFETGSVSPDGWALEGCDGTWLGKDAARGKRAVAVKGNGQDTGFWRSAPVAFAPGGVYVLRFAARGIDTSGGTPVTGPIFCNRDLGAIPGEWRRYESVFTAPATVDASNNWLHFGQWQTTGTVAFDDVTMTSAEPYHVRVGDLTIGSGESVSGNSYSFQAPFDSECRNYSRPLARHDCGFNTNRWVFRASMASSAGQALAKPAPEVVYHHRLGNRRQTTATVEVAVTWYEAGELVVEASADGKIWTVAGTIGQQASAVIPVPATLLPAVDVWIRLSARSTKKVGVNSDPGDAGPQAVPGIAEAGVNASPGSFQVGRYGYRSVFDGAPVTAAGRTGFLSVKATDPRVTVAIRSLGDQTPAGDNRVVAVVTNLTGGAITCRPLALPSRNGLSQVSVTSDAVLEPGAQDLIMPYNVDSAGKYDLSIALGGDLAYQATTSFIVPYIDDATYGELLPGSGDTAALWWAQSGWKIGRTRPAPSSAGRAISIQAAGNEAEAAQLVIRPTRTLTGFTATPTPLSGPGGRTMPAGSVDILRVRYVPVTIPTDASSVTGPWPDPLPPFKGALDLAPGLNQPLWIRVRVPRGTAPGTYRGTIRLAAEGFSADVPVTVEVFGFDLPDRMTCVTAFGFSPNLAWDYQKVTDPEQKREVLDKYLSCLAAHHISPYDPAPLDPFVISWPGAGKWEGGKRVGDVKHSGRSSLLVADTSLTAQSAAVYGAPVAIPAGGVRLKFWYRTMAPAHKFIVSLSHLDASGKWMSGRNLDIPLAGDGKWQAFDKTFAKFPEGARSLRLSLYADEWMDDGSPTGTVWYDDVSLSDPAGGGELVTGGDFEPLPLSALKPQIDWKAWDVAMERAFTKYHFNSFALPVPGLGGGNFMSRHEPSLLGYGENTAEYKAAFGSCLAMLETHLKEKGWLADAFVYWFDEPDPKDYAFVLNGFRKIREAAPGIGRMLTEQPEPDLEGGPNIWCPLTPEWNDNRAAGRKKLGERFWWYVCTGPKEPYAGLFIDHPGTELRVWLWQTWQRGISGILVWHTNFWSSWTAYPDTLQNPYEDPMGWTDGFGVAKGTKEPWGNGDGRFMYPPEAASAGTQRETVLDGPVDSIRLEMLRDGIEDYEYLAILQRLLDGKGKSLPEKKRKDLEALLTVPPSISKDLTVFTKDPAPITARRIQVARAIEELTGVKRSDR